MVWRWMVPGKVCVCVCPACVLASWYVICRQHIFVAFCPPGSILSLMSFLLPSTFVHLYFRFSAAFLDIPFITHLFLHLHKLPCFPLLFLIQHFSPSLVTTFRPLFLILSFTFLCLSISHFYPSIIEMLPHPPAHTLTTINTFTTNQKRRKTQRTRIQSTRLISILHAV